jgi:SAM-dependent methyltransferase
MTPTVAEQLEATAAAFDSVAPTYDGPQGNNQLIHRMREIVWDRIALLLDGPSTLIDIGCGTGIDAQHFAQLGHHVHATDWSPAMVERAAARQVEGTGSITASPVGAQELHRLHVAPGSVDLSYSNFGPLNCVPDLGETASALAVLTRPGGHAVFTVIGRYCPWEVAHYARRRRWSRMRVRFSRAVTPVGMNGHTIWTRYFSPREFVREWIGTDGDWELDHYEALSLFVPPPYLEAVSQRHPRLFGALVEIDRRTARWPVARAMGDHFLVVLRRR